MATPQLAVRANPATGQSIVCWLDEELSTSGTGGMSLFTVTYSQVDLAEPNSLPSLIAYRHGITDPEAEFRLKEPELLNWTKNLHDLNVVAGMILPGIRELTEPEQRNLRSIYRKLYRKA
jgi:hypothetical protein